MGNAEPTPDVEALRLELAELTQRAAEIRRLLGIRKRASSSQRITATDWPLIIERVINGETLREVAKSYGVSRQRIDQILAEQAPGAGMRGRQMRHALEREQRVIQAEVAAVQQALKAGPCATCLGPVTRPDRRQTGRATCSPRCAELWARCRWKLDPDAWRKHRQSVARSHLKSDTTTPVQRRHAERVLAGTAETRGRWVNSPAMQEAMAEIERLRRAVQDSGESWWH